MPTLSPMQTMAAAYLGGFRGNDLIVMTAIAAAESSYRTDVYNGQCCYGLWQINCKPNAHGAKDICKNENWKNPVKNAAFAKQLKGSQGLGAWEVYTNGAYKQFLGQAQKAKTDLSNNCKSRQIGARTNPLGFVLGSVKTEQDCARDIIREAGFDPEGAGGYFGTTPGAIGEAVGGVPDVGSAILAAIKAPVEFANRIGSWMSEPGNWLRVIGVIAGGALVVAGVGILAKPMINATPAGRAVKIAKKAVT